MEQRKYDEFNYVSKKKLHNYPFLWALYDWKIVCSREMTVSTSGTGITQL